MPLQIIRQDITKLQVDAIVNPTNRNMVGCSGVDLLVHQIAGPELDAECAAFVPLESGAAVVTRGYGLPCSRIIHTCGPVWQGGSHGEESLLKRCYRACLLAAVEIGCDTVAFPLISSGVYGYPKAGALSLAVREITDFLCDHELTVYLCVFDRDSYRISQRLFTDIRSYLDERCAETADLYESAPRMACRARAPRRSEALFAADVLPCPAPLGSEIHTELGQYLKKLDLGFADTLFSLIDKKGMTDVACYKRANVSRKTFSKIRCDPNYRPSKETAVAFAIALQLDLAETESFLKTAGITLSRSYKFDMIVEYFISHGIYDVFEINQALFEFDQPCLGC